MSTQLIRGDAAHLPLADGSVDVIVTSPPYFALRSYQDGGEHYDGQIGSEPTPQDFLKSLWAVTEECKRVLKPSGSIFWNLGDKYAGSGGHNNSGISTNGMEKSTLGGKAKLTKLNQTEDRTFKGGGGAERRTDQRNAVRRQAPDRYNQSGKFGDNEVPRKSLMGLPWRYAIGCIDRLGLILRAEIIWSKANGLPESVTDRVRRSHEQWFHFTKEPIYYANVDEVREPHAAVSLKRASPHRANTLSNEDTNEIRSEQMVHPNGKLPGSVWTISTEPLVVPEYLGLSDHFAAFPQEWPRKFILGWCPPDGVVLDPFCGTGTTVGVANALGRHGIGVDMSSDYLTLAKWRINHSGHFAKTVSRTNGERQGVLV